MSSQKLSKGNKILERRLAILSKLKSDYRTHAKGSTTQIPISTMVWNLYNGGYEFSYADLYWLIETLKKEENENGNKQIIDSNFLC